MEGELGKAFETVAKQSEDKEVSHILNTKATVTGLGKITLVYAVAWDEGGEGTTSTFVLGGT